jgi:hypothetical protein
VCTSSSIQACAGSRASKKDSIRGGKQKWSLQVVKTAPSSVHGALNRVRSAFPELIFYSFATLISENGYAGADVPVKVCGYKPKSDNASSSWSNIRSRYSPTYSSSLRFRSLASSRCFCSSASLCLVASPYSLLRSLVVTFSHNFRLSLGSCFSRGRTTLGTVCKISRSTSVWNSAVDDTDALEPKGLRRHRMRFRQQPSKKAITRD